MENQAKTDLFEKARPRLLGLAYRLLASKAEAEDVVQDVYLKWREASEAEIQNSHGWLITVCTRNCIDILKSAHKSRVEYVGPWLPEPVITFFDEDQEGQIDLAVSLSTAFLLLLERLSPRERAAYLLHDVFDHDYQQVSEILNVEQPACRKLVSRAREHVSQDKKRYEVPREKQQEFLSVFQDAVQSGSTDNLSRLLSEDIVFCSDGGGKVVAARRPVSGRERVLNFIEKVLIPAWSEITFESLEVNGLESLSYFHKGRLSGVITFSYGEQNKIENIYVMRNPEKLILFQRRVSGNQPDIL
ncbi:MAG: RNA polymerase sigma factor SigJ [Methyloligellaceae bacterium]